MKNKIEERKKRQNQVIINRNGRIDYLRDLQKEKEELLKNRKHQWIKRKLREISSEYKYNFFLRVGLQAYLEA